VEWDGYGEPIRFNINEGSEAPFDLLSPEYSSTQYANENIQMLSLSNNTHVYDKNSANPDAIHPYVTAPTVSIDQSRWYGNVNAVAVRPEEL
jgi:hypothetical protein